MNILQINNYVGPPTYCPPFRPVYLGREWTKQGHRVTIVGASTSHMFHTKPHFRGAMAIEEDEGVRFLMLRTPDYSGNGLTKVKHMFSFVAGIQRYASQICDVARPDIVIAGSVHGLDCIPAARLARKRHLRFVREVRDLWPLTLTELGGISRYHPFVLLLQRVEDYSYSRADMVLSTLPNSLSHMHRHGLDPQRWVYIPQGVDIAEWKSPKLILPAYHQGVLESMRAKDRFIVAYTGSLGIANCLHTLLEAARLLRDKPVSFVLVGEGAEKPSLQDFAREAGLLNLSFLPRVPKKFIPSLLSMVDATYIGWSKHALYRFGISPNKLMDYMCAAKPIVHSVECTNDLVQVSHCGITVPPEDAGAIARAIVQLMSMEVAERDCLGERGRAYVAEHHDYRVLAKQYLEVLDSSTGSECS